MSPMPVDSTVKSGMTVSISKKVHNQTSLCSRLQVSGALKESSALTSLVSVTWACGQSEFTCIPINATQVLASQVMLNSMKHQVIL